MIRLRKAILDRHRQVLVGLLLFLIWSAGYFVIARFTDLNEAKSFMTRLDRHIPFRPEFVFIYLTIYPVYLLPLFLVKHWRFFNIMAWAYITVMLICYAIFLSYPVRIERPEFAVDSFSTWALSLVYRFDSPVNCFPSMHAAMAMTSALTLYELSRRGGALALLLTITIGASTLFIKQHFVVDIFAGFVLALVVYHIYFRGEILDVLRAEAHRLETAIEEAVNSRINERIDERFQIYLDRELDRRIEEILERKAGGKDGSGGKTA